MKNIFISTLSSMLMLMFLISCNSGTENSTTTASSSTPPSVSPDPSTSPAPPVVLTSSTSPKISCVLMSKNVQEDICIESGVLAAYRDAFIEGFKQGCVNDNHGTYTDGECDKNIFAFYQTISKTEDNLKADVGFYVKKATLERLINSSTKSLSEISVSSGEINDDPLLLETEELLKNALNMMGR